MENWSRKEAKSSDFVAKKVESRNGALRCLFMAFGHYALRLLMSTEKYSLPLTIPDNSKILDVFRISAKACLRNRKNLTCTTSYGVC
ncbi:MAG: hypothetical protein ACW7DW_14460 [Paraglaciecola chathamensis]